MNRTNEDVRRGIMERVELLNKQRARQKRILCRGVPTALCLCLLMAALLPVASKSQSDTIKNSAESQGTTVADAYSQQGQKATQPPIDTSAETGALEITQQLQSSDKLNSNSSRPIKNSDKVSISLFEYAHNPNNDAFGDDGLPNVDVVIGGSFKYTQLPKSDYTDYGLSLTLSSSDFGEFLGVVQETGLKSSAIESTYPVGADNPKLVGAYAYCYAPLGESAIILQGNGKCSIFLFDGMINDVQSELYAKFGATSAKGIEYLEYIIRIPHDKGLNKIEFSVLDEGKVTNREAIERFYDITSTLLPYQTGNMPDWLNDAIDEKWENYYDVWEEITITVHFTNGLKMELYYEPFLATGYIEGMEALTSAQNSELRALLVSD